MRKQKQAKEFIERQNNKLKAHSEAQAKERYEKEMMEEEKQLKKDQLKKQKQVKMAQFYQQQGQELKDIEAKERNMLDKLWRTEQVQSAFQASDRPLQSIFKEYSIQDKKKEIGAIDEVQTLSLPAFIKFTKFYGLCAARELSQDDLTLVFRAVVRDRKNDGNPNEITYENFQVALLRSFLLRECDGPEKPLQRQVSVATQHQFRTIEAIDGIDVFNFSQFLQKLSSNSIKGYQKAPTRRGSKLRSREGSQEAKLLTERTNNAPETMPHKASTKIANENFESQSMASGLPAATPVMPQGKEIKQSTIEDDSSLLGTIKKQANPKININEEDAKAVKLLLEFDD